MKKWMCFGAVGLIALAGGACGKDDDALDTALQLIAGTWATACENVGGGYYAIFSNTFSDRTMTGVVRYYSDASCSTLQHESQGVATVSNGSSSSSVSGAYNYDFTWSALTITPKSAGQVTNFNGISYCGVSAWVLNTAQSVAGSTCGSTVIPSAGSMKYDIIKVSSNVLQFGDTSGVNNGTTSALRPASLESRQYVKQ